MSTASTSESALAARRRLLGAITLVLLVGEVVSAFFITFVAGAVIFACLFGVGALLVRRGGVAGPFCARLRSPTSRSGSGTRPPR